MYVRPKNNVRDMGLSGMKTIKELEQELNQMDDLLRASQDENKRASEKLRDLEDARAEMEDLSNYYVRKASVAKEEMGLVRESIPVDVLLASIRTLEQDRDFLKANFSIS